MERPSEEEVANTAARTQAALEKLINGKIKAAQPKNVANKGEANVSYVRYTPGQGNDDGSKQRIIKMVDVVEDPLEPPRFKAKKIPRGPPSPPAPILRSPPRKITAQDQKDWMIPPCVSNWKNNKGYTIPLDKRLAADGRGLQDVSLVDVNRWWTISDHILRRSTSTTALPNSPSRSTSQTGMLEKRSVNVHSCNSVSPRSRRRTRRSIFACSPRELERNVPVLQPLPHQQEQAGFLVHLAKHRSVTIPTTKRRKHLQPLAEDVSPSETIRLLVEHQTKSAAKARLKKTDEPPKSVKSCVANDDRSASGSFGCRTWVPSSVPAY